MIRTFTRLLLSVLIVLAHQVIGQSDRKVYLKFGEIDGNHPSWIGSDQFSRLLTGSRRTQPVLGLIRLEKSLATEQIKHLKKSGIYLQGYVPDNAWVAVISEETGDLQSLKSLGFTGFLELSPEMKVEQRILDGNLTTSANTVRGMADLWVKIPDYFKVDSIKRVLEKEYIQILSDENKSFGILEIRVPVQRVRALAEKCYIEFIQEKPAPLTNTSYNSKSRMNAHLMRSPSDHYLDGLKGRGIKVGIGDNTDPVRHIDFAGRLVNRFNTTGGDGHGLHVMGILGGGGILWEDMRGLAPKAELISQYFSRIITYSPEYYNDFGMRLTNNSYGITVTGDESFRRYDMTSWLVDYLTYEYPEMLHVFAAGNSGYSNLPDNPYRNEIAGARGFGTVLTGYQSAKNALVVGNADSTFVRARTSSRGPTQDGRVRPDVLAEGTEILSALRDNTYGKISGTSMAAPAVTGAAALLSEQYKIQYGEDKNPPAGLLKALICNGANDQTPVGPDHTAGFGFMNLHRSSQMLRNEQYIIGTIGNSDVINHTIPIPANTSALKVMLYWVDPPGNIIAAKALVNDLDLKVTVNGTTTLPYLVPTAPASIRNKAGRGVDRINNIEQVEVTSPAGTSAQISVTGFNVPMGPQQYFIVYDYIPAKVLLLSPAPHEAFAPGQKMSIMWESGTTTSTFNVQYYNGSTWENIATSLAASARQYIWTIPTSLRTSTGRVRVVRVSDGETSESQDFTVIGTPVISLATSSSQCEGLIKVNWTSVQGATGYELMKLEGDEMKSVETVPSNQTSYYFRGLSPDSTYWVSVRALINNQPGRRAQAVSRRPNTGTCSDAISNGDLAIVAITSPAGSGRLNTSTALSNQTAIKFKIKNRDNQQFNGKQVKITCKINDGTPVQQNVNLPNIAAGGEYEVSFSNKFNLSAVGTYRIEVGLEVSGDQVQENNTYVTEVAQIANPPISLSVSPQIVKYNENFDNMPLAKYYTLKKGLEGADRYDFSSTGAGGRMRSFVNTSLTRSGNRSITMDTDNYPHTKVENSLIGTYNMSSFNTNQDIRLSFWFMPHGQQFGSTEKVWVRGNDTQEWIVAFDLGSVQPVAGEYKRSASIKLSNVLKSKGQQYSASTQVKWGQAGTYQVASTTEINGYTIDDVEITLAFNDIELKELIAPKLTNCDLGTQEPVTIKVYNSMDYAVTNVNVYYQIDEGPVVMETISQIAANTEMNYTFSTRANLSAYKYYTLKTWASLAGDHDPLNDEVTRQILNSPLVTSFPYLENFENGPGNWFTGGELTSWEYGTPSSTLINRAASGLNAWKTRLAGNYNSYEHSYLYSPCFDISGLTNPTLSFMVALDIENCAETFCDASWVEYSFDGVNWTILGQLEEGTNWYNKYISDIPHWSVANFTNWHVATIPLPKQNGSSQQVIRIRFVMNSDISVTREGIAIDDIHVYDRFASIANSFGTDITRNINSPNATWTHFTSNNRVSVSINPNGSTPNLGSVRTVTYLNNGPVRFRNNSYMLDRSFVIQPNATAVNPGAQVRLYFSDNDFNRLLTADNCPDCAKATSVVDLGISKYSYSQEENGTPEDNNQNTSWSFILPSVVNKVPFADGYYVEFTTNTFSEFWLSSQPIFTSTPLPVRLTKFTARLNEENEVQLDWTINEASDFSHFEIQRAIGNEGMDKGKFVTIANIHPGEDIIRSYRYVDPEPGGDIVYYRLKMVDLDGSYSYSEVRSVHLETTAAPLIYPNPSGDGFFFLDYQTLQNIEYKVIDALGRTIKSGYIEGNGFKQKSPIDLRHIGNGVYLIEVQAGDRKSAFRIVKQ